MANIKTLGRKLTSLSTKFAAVAKALADVSAEYEALSSATNVVGKAETVERRKPAAGTNAKPKAESKEKPVRKAGVEKRTATTQKSAQKPLKKTAEEPVQAVAVKAKKKRK